MKKITLRKPEPKDFLLTWFISACGIAMPFVDGGLFNLASYAVLFYGWLFGILLFTGTFMNHMDSFPDVKPWQKTVTSIPRTVAIILLAYAEFYWHATLLVFCWMFAAVIMSKTKSAYEDQQDAMKY